jgi:hypothetical protein
MKKRTRKEWKSNAQMWDACAFAKVINPFLGWVWTEARHKLLWRNESARARQWKSDGRCVQQITHTQLHISASGCERVREREKQTCRADAHQLFSPLSTDVVVCYLGVYISVTHTTQHQFMAPTKFKCSTYIHGKKIVQCLQCEKVARKKVKRQPILLVDLYIVHTL